MRYLFRLLFAWALALGFAAPGLAQALETEARRAAAIADYRKSCASTYSVAKGGDLTFLEHRSRRDQTYSNFLNRVVPLRPAAELQEMLRRADVTFGSGGGDRSGRCAVEVAIRHALHGVPGFDHGIAGGGGSSAPAPGPKPAPKAAAPKAALTAQQARDKKEEAAIVKELDEWIKQDPMIEPCTWTSGAVQNPCLKHNFERGIEGSEWALAKIEARRRRFSPEGYEALRKAFEGSLAHNRLGCANLASTTIPCDTMSASETTVAARDEAEDSAAPPKRKIGTLTHVLALGNPCISVRMLPYNPQENQALDEIELKNDCSTPQIITNYVQMDGSPWTPLQYVHGPPYYDWRGKYPPTLPPSVYWSDPGKIGTFTMWPGNVTTASFPGGKNLTIKTGACDYTDPNKVINKLYTDGDSGLPIDGFNWMTCVPNPEPPPPKPWP